MPPGASQVRREGASVPSAARRQRPLTLRDLSARYLKDYATANKRSCTTDRYRFKPLPAALGDVLLRDLRADAGRAV